MSSFDPIHEHRACRRFEQPVGVPDERRLPCAVLPDYRNGLSLPDRKADVRECDHAILMDERDVLELNEGHSSFNSCAISSGVSGIFGSLIPSFERSLYSFAMGGTPTP